LQGESRHLAVFAALCATDIDINIHYIPMYLRPFYVLMCFAPGDFSLAENFYGRAISLAFFLAINEAQQCRVSRRFCNLNVRLRLGAAFAYLNHQ
tara:strand:- start:573 stop:857 length:285 start_codon:yes stop_codon:yes gene_type:complete